MPNDIALEEDLYSWLTEDLGWTPQEAYQEISADPSEYREPEAPVQPKESPDQKLGAVLLANEAMKAEEASLESRWREAGRQGITPEQAEFINRDQKFGKVMPTSKGFMYVANPVTPPEGWVNPRQQAYDRGLASGLITKPSPQPSAAELVQNPDYDAFQAQERYRIMLQATGDPKRAFAAAGPAILRIPGIRSSTSRSMTPNQQAQAEHWRNIDELAKAKLQAPTTATGTTGGPSPRALESEIKAERDYIRNLELKNSVTEEMSPEYWQYSDLLARHRARLAELERQQKGGGTVTAPVSAPKPAETTSGERRVRVKSPSGKWGTIPESQLKDALKAGYSVG